MTMLIHSLEHEFVYIDPSKQAVEGDGSSPSSPLYNMPTSLTGNKIYLVRRSAPDRICTVSNGTSADSSVESLVIWGMPTESDSHWDMVPDEAKEAWGEDTDTTAWVQFTANSSRHCMRANYARNIDLRSFTFMSLNRTDTGAYYCLYAGSSSTICNMHAEKVHFRDATADFTVGTQPHSYSGGQYINIATEQYAHLVELIDCRVDHWSGYGHGLYLGRQHNVVIKGCDINISQAHNNYRTIYWCDEDYYQAPMVTIKDCNVRLYMSKQSDRWTPYVFYGNATILNVNNVDYRMATEQYWTPYGNTIYLRPLIQVSIKSPGSVIENITCDFSNHISGLSYSLISLDYTPGESGGSLAAFGQYTIVRNINITMARTPQYGCGGNDNGGYVWNTSEYECGMLRLYSENYSRGSSSDYLLQDIHISAPRGIGMYCHNALLDMKSCDIEGSIRLCRCTGKIGAISTWYPGYAVCDDGGNLLYIKSITCNRNNPSWEYNGQYAVVPSYRSNILCGTTNVLYMPPSHMSTSYTRCRCSYICTNDQISGNYTARNSFSDCRTWSVNRVGSTGGCTLKLTNESGQDDTMFPLIIAGEPFKGIAIQTSAGEHVATFYAALFGYNDFSQIANKLRIKITKPDGTIVTSMSGNWVVDTESVWENVEGHTVYRCDVPFLLEESGEIQVEYQFSWYMQGGVTYLDPYPVIS